MRAADPAVLPGRIPDLSPRWREAMHAVPRHLFIPDRGWCLKGQDQGYAIDRAADPKAWWEAVHAPDAAIVTQLDEGMTDVACTRCRTRGWSRPGRAG